MCDYEAQLLRVIENYGEAADSQLAKLYRCSVAFVYPSLYEGFGIPPLEAMACGTAVIAVNCLSIPEVELVGGGRRDRVSKIHKIAECG